jgi:hypothetical protein
MGDRPKRNETLGAPVLLHPPVIDWTSVFAKQQANMNIHNSIAPQIIPSEMESMWYNWTPGMNPAMPPNQAVHPEKFVYFPPLLPKDWDLSRIHLQTPQIPGNMGDLVGGPFF